MNFHRACFLGLLILQSVPLPAQDEPSPFKLNVNVDVVQLHVTVVDEKDRTVGGLKKEDFKVHENDEEQTISVFKHEDIPVSLGLVIDNSRSIEPRKDRLDAAALSFIRKSNADDEAFVVHFDFDARLSHDFTSNVGDIERTLAATKPYGQTAIYDAILLALHQMDAAKYPKKALLLITDGIDNVSTHTLSEVIEELKHSHVTVFSVGLLSDSGGSPAEESLIRIAETSGGRAYFPENVEQARSMMERIARDLREQYTLEYFPTNSNPDRTWRSVRVDVVPPPGFPKTLVPNFRRGYYGGAQ